MNQQGRFLLFIAISLLIIILWSAFFAPPPPKAKPPPPKIATRSTPAPKRPAPSPAPAPAPVAPAPRAAPEAAPPVTTQVVDTRNWTATFTSRGAGIERFVLKGKKDRRHIGKVAEGVNLAHPAKDQPVPLSTTIGPADQGFGATTRYRVGKFDPKAGILTYERTQNGLTVTKTFTWKDGSYALGLQVAVRSVTGAAATVPVKVEYSAWEAHPKTGGLFAFATRAEIHQAACYLAGSRSMDTRDYGKVEAPKTFTSAPAFAAIDEKYFLAAIAPQGGLASAPGATCTLASPKPNELVASYSRALEVPAGGSGSAQFDLFLGPKATGLLHAWGHGSDVSVYNGSIAKVGKLLIPILRAFHHVANNWGVAIILLTVLVKVITLPLSHRQMKSMDQMKAIAPKLEAIKKKYEGNTQRINEETMKLYKEHNINPIGCAVPMLVQMPIWWALYETLGASYELYNEPFIHGWINDLTVMDPYYVLPILMTVTMFGTQLLTPQATPQQGQMKAMTYGMPIFFGFLMMALPAGLVLYIFTSNVLSILQSLWYRRRYPSPAPAPAPLK